jgi:hypothetical protein
MESGSQTRIIATVKKNLERLVNLPSFLKVIGLNFDERCIMLDVLKGLDIHVWLLNDSQQHLIYLSEKDHSDYGGYQWQ